MREFGERSVMDVQWRVGVWLVAFLLAVALFTLLLSLFLGNLGSEWLGLCLNILRVTSIFALPVWCLYLPVVIAIKNAEEWRAWTLLVSGSLIGPVLMALCSVVLILRGDSAEKVWQGDPLLGWLGGGIATIILSLIVGFLTTSLYVIGLKVLHRRSIGDGASRERLAG